MPPRKATPEELAEAYLIACHKCTKHALETTVIRLIRGELDGYDKRFAPSPAELSAAMRNEMEFVQKQNAIAADRAAIEHKPNLAVPHKYVDLRVKHRDRALELQRQGYSLIASDVNSEQFRAMTKKKTLPAGAVHLFAIDEVWSPAPMEAAASPMGEKINDDIPW